MSDQVHNKFSHSEQVGLVVFLLLTSVVTLDIWALMDSVRTIEETLASCPKIFKPQTCFKHM